MRGHVRDVIDHESFLKHYNHFNELCAQISQEKFDALFDEKGYLKEDSLTDYPELNAIFQQEKNQPTEENQAMAAIARAAIYVRRLPSNDMKMINRCFEKNDGLNSLRFYDELNLSDVIAIVNIVSCMRPVSLELWGPNNIGDAGAAIISQALEMNHTLTALYLMRDKISAEGARALAAVLRVDRTLTTLSLLGNQIGGAGVKAIAEGLETNNALVTLDLSGNHVGDEGVKALVEALKMNQTLTTLNLASNKISIEGIKIIAEALKTNKRLATLNLWGSNIGDAGAAIILKALEMNHTLTNLNLGGSEISAKGVKVIMEALKTNHTLATLNVGNNAIGLEGAKAIAEMLKTNHTVRTLWLGWSKINLEGRKMIAEALKTNQTLTYLCLYSYDIVNEDLSTFEEVFQNNYSILDFDLEPLGEDGGEGRIKVLLKLYLDRNKKIKLSEALIKIEKIIERCCDGQSKPAIEELQSGIDEGNQLLERMVEEDSLRANEIKMNIHTKLKVLIDARANCFLELSQVDQLIKAWMDIPESSPYYDHYRFNVFQYLFHQDKNEEKLAAFVNALKSLVKEDGALLLAFKDPHNQLVFDAALASAAGVRLTGSGQRFKSLDSNERLAYLKDALSKWTPTDVDDIAFKSKCESRFNTLVFSQSLQAFGLLSDSQDKQSEGSSPKQDLKK